MTPATLDRSQSLFHVFLLLALCGVLYFPYLGSTPIFDKGEPREGLAVQDIVQRGEWLFPLKRAEAIPSKPPMFHWSAALTYQFTGVLDEATLRFPSALYATLGVISVYLVGAKLFGPQVGLLGGAILATTMIYQTQAVNARVDMTLCFFVTLSLILFYSIYRGFFTHPIWPYAMYLLVGLATLSKGPLGLVLPGLVIASFLALKRDWKIFFKFALHPGVMIAVVLVVGWYGLAISRGGEGFVNRQLLSENVSRFFGGSGHSHPIYYYFSYLFSLATPWCLFYPFMFWDWAKERSGGDGDALLFLQTWFGVMLLFFSLSSGKRAVYLLPIYPALALLLALWCRRQGPLGFFRMWFLRIVSAVAFVTALVVLFIALGDLWTHDPARLFAPIEQLLKPKDRANFLVIVSQIADFGWKFDAAALAWAALWSLLAYYLWRGRTAAAGGALVALSIILAFFSRGLVEAKIAETKSYRDFMIEVNRLVPPSEKLVLSGGFNGDAVAFYRGGMVEVAELPIDNGSAQIAAGGVYIITTEKNWKRLQQAQPELASPLLRSRGRGPEGDAPLVLLRGALQ
ncbi:MAG TPA: glycosyltransferase family 39 protein [Candidatus Binatia bacterium]|nr:glycosyltransferase family 39 protein [Candidatus Binatia bacterium]